jgi:hypothetical protein
MFRASARLTSAARMRPAADTLQRNRKAFQRLGLDDLDEAIRGRRHLLESLRLNAEEERGRPVALPRQDERDDLVVACLLELAPGLLEPSEHLLLLRVEGRSPEQAADHAVDLRGEPLHLRLVLLDPLLGDLVDHGGDDGPNLHELSLQADDARQREEAVLVHRMDLGADPAETSIADAGDQHAHHDREEHRQQ